MMLICSNKGGLKLSPLLSKNTPNPPISKVVLFFLSLSLSIISIIVGCVFCFLITGEITQLFKIVLLTFNGIFMFYIIFLFYMFLILFLNSGISLNYNNISINWSKDIYKNFEDYIKTKYSTLKTSEINKAVENLKTQQKEIQKYLPNQEIINKINEIFNVSYGDINPSVIQNGSLLFNINEYIQRLDNIIQQQLNISSNKLKSCSLVISEIQKTNFNIQKNAEIIDGIKKSIQLNLNGTTDSIGNVINKQLNYFNSNCYSVKYENNLFNLPLGLYNITFFQDFDNYLKDGIPYNAKESIFLNYLQSQVIFDKLKTLSINQVIRGICFNLSNSSSNLNIYFINQNGKIYFFVFLNNNLILCSNGFIVYFTTSLIFNNYSFKTETKVSIFDVLENSFRFYSLLSTIKNRSSTNKDLLIMIGEESTSLFYEVFQKVDEQFFDSFQSFQLNNENITFSSSVNDGIIHNINSILGSIQIIYKYNSVNLILNNTQIFSLTLNNKKFLANINNQTILLNEKS